MYKKVLHFCDLASEQLRSNEKAADSFRGAFPIEFNVPGDDIMHFTDSCRFLISSAFKFTAL